MKSDKHPFYIISVIFNLFFILVAAVFTAFFYNYEISSKIGDTIGGTLGPLIGSVSIYYLYKTYQEQTNTLNEQKKALEEQKKVSFEQRSTTFYVEILSSLRKVIEGFEDLSFAHTFNPGPQETREIIKGKRILQSFLNLNGENIQSFDEDIPAKDDEFLRDIIRAYEHFLNVQNRKVRLQNVLTNQHYGDITDEIKRAMADYGSHINSIFYTIAFYINLKGTEGHTNRGNQNINIIMFYIQQFQNLAIQFEDEGILQRNFGPMQAFNFQFEIPLDLELRERINFNLEYN